MAIEDLIDRNLSFGPLEVGPESIVAFSKGINEERPVHRDPTSPDFHAHPMYAATALIPASGQVVFQPDAEVDVGRIVHGGIEINFHRAIRPGGRLEARSALQSTDVKSSGRILNIGFEVFDRGEPVVSGTTAYFERGKGDKSKTSTSIERDKETICLHELCAQTKKDQSVLYAEGSGDRFPIHTDDSFAQSVGLPGMIMHGMCTLALSVNAIFDKLVNSEAISMRSLRCQFRSIVLPGNTLVVRVHRHEAKRLEFTASGTSQKPAISSGVIEL